MAGGTNGQARDEIWRQADQIVDYLTRLEGLVTEPPAPPGGPAGMTGRPAHVPEPYGPAGRVLMDMHEGIRRLEASLRLIVLGHLGRRRGGSAGNTADALAMVTKLASRLDDKGATRCAAYLQRHINAAGTVDGIDEARRWRHLPKDPGEALPPQCPFCGMFYLLADVEAQLVACSYPACPGDSNGDPPIAVMGWDETGRPILTWADGKTQVAPDLQTGTAAAR